MMMSYGHQIAPEGDMYVTIADKALAGLAQAGIFGTYLVDYMSFRTRALLSSQVHKGLTLTQ